MAESELTRRAGSNRLRGVLDAIFLPTERIREVSKLKEGFTATLSNSPPPTLQPKIKAEPQGRALPLSYRHSPLLYQLFTPWQRQWRTTSHHLLSTRSPFPFNQVLLPLMVSESFPAKSPVLEHVTHWRWGMGVGGYIS